MFFLKWTKILVYLRVAEKTLGPNFIEEPVVMNTCIYSLKNIKTPWSSIMVQLVLF